MISWPQPERLLLQFGIAGLPMQPSPEKLWSDHLTMTTLHCPLQTLTMDQLLLRWTKMAWAAPSMQSAECQLVKKIWSSSTLALSDPLFSQVLPVQIYLIRGIELLATQTPLLLTLHLAWTPIHSTAAEGPWWLRLGLAAAAVARNANSAMIADWDLPAPMLMLRSG